MSISILIILITAAISIPAFKQSELFYKLDFNPSRIKENKEYIRFIGHAFLHADWWHLAINMFVLWMFGTSTEYYFEAYSGNTGRIFFIALYFGAILFSSIPSYKKHQDNYSYHSVGASGAVSAVVFSSVIFNPANALCLYGVFCLPGIVWAIVYLIYSYQKGKQSNDYVNHDAHFWGAIFGVSFTILVVPETIPVFIQQVLSLLPF